MSSCWLVSLPFGCQSHFHSAIKCHHHQSVQIELCLHLTGNKFSPGMNRDGLVSLDSWVTQRQQSGMECIRGGCDEPPRFHTINYSDITSPVAQDSAGKGQLSGSHNDQLVMHVTAPNGPAGAVYTSHLQDMSNASARLLIAPKMPQQGLLTRA